MPVRFTEKCVEKFTRKFIQKFDEKVDSIINENIVKFDSTGLIRVSEVFSARKRSETKVSDQGFVPEPRA